MNDIEEFERLSIDDKVSLIIESDIQQDDPNLEYWKDLILKTDSSNNHWLLSNIIDLATNLNFKDERLSKRYVGYISGRYNYIVKLSVLDYFLLTDQFSSVLEKELFELIKSNHDLLLVKNHALLLLAYFDKVNRKEHLNTLLIYMKRTRDYRSHIRVYNTLLAFNLITNHLDMVKEMTNISMGMNLGKAVRKVLREVESVAT